jgi:hypothetical protein
MPAAYSASWSHVSRSPVVGASRTFRKEEGTMSTLPSPKFMVRLHADSLVRLNQKPYLEEGEVKSLVLKLPGATVAIFDRFMPLADLFVPNGLIINVELEAPDIDHAVGNAVGVTTYVLSLLSCVTNAAVGQPMPIWVYDSTRGVVDREFRFFAYNAIPVTNTRIIDQSSLMVLLEKMFNGFFSDPTVKDDWKDRVQRAVTAFRRGLADNDDVLTEFIIVWSSMEGLDCVYRKVLPSRKSDFMDGVRDVLDRLGYPHVFDTLKGLRDGLAHGNFSLADVNSTASSNLELVRRALLLMVLRILKVEQEVCDRVLRSDGYKGKVIPRMKYLASIRCEPGDVSRLDTHPVMEFTIDRMVATKDGDKLTLQPTLNLTPKNLAGMEARGWELWGDSGLKLVISETQVEVIRKGEGETGDRSA